MQDPHTRQINKSDRGFTLLEIAASMIITAVGILAASTFLRILSSQSASRQFNDGITTSLTQAFEHIIRVGRGANECAKVVGGLECTLHFRSDTTAPTYSNVRFEVKASGTLGTSSLGYLTRTGNSPDESWATSLTYDGVQSLVICDSSDMNVSAPEPRCPLNSTAGIGSFRNVSKSFYRFRLLSSKGTALNGAFFVRNQGLIAGLRYEWGNTE